METLLYLDTQVFYALNSLIEHGKFVDTTVLFCAQYLIFILIAIVVIDIARRDAFAVWRFPHDMARLAITLASTFGINELLRTLIGRVRPLWALTTPHLFALYTPSFPSGHTAFVFALGTFLLLFGEKRLARVVYVFGTLVALGRVMAGVHYPLDIIGGAIVGTVVAWIMYVLLTRAPK